jgi:hypothetical protein
MKMDIDEKKETVTYAYMENDFSDMDKFLRNLMQNAIAGEMRNYNPNWNNPGTGHATAIEVSTKIVDEIEERLWQLPPVPPEKATQYRDALMALKAAEIEEKYKPIYADYQAKAKSWLDKLASGTAQNTDEYNEIRAKVSKYSANAPKETDKLKAREIADAKRVIYAYTEWDARDKIPKPEAEESRGNIPTVVFSTIFNRLKGGVRRALHVMVAPDEG